MFEDCIEDGCGEIAIGTSRWQPRQRRGQPLAANPYRPDPPRCRPHHLAAIADRIETYAVTGPLGIVDVVTSETVHRGGTVRLDPAETFVKPLVQLKYIGPVASTVKATAKVSSEPKA
jgi:hypothetical protein